MTIDEVLRHFKVGTMSHEEAHAWITTSIERAAVMAKLEMLNKIEADIDAMQARQA